MYTDLPSLGAQQLNGWVLEAADIPSCAYMVHDAGTSVVAGSDCGSAQSYITALTGREFGVTHSRQYVRAINVSASLEVTRL